MKYRAECQKDFFDKAKAEGCEVNGLAFVQNEKDIYIRWADKKIEFLLEAQKAEHNSEYTKCPNCGSKAKGFKTPAMYHCSNEDCQWSGHFA